MTATVGQEAPEFTLPGTGGREYTLSQYRGHPVVLVFYPGDNSKVCTLQLNSYTRDIEAFTQLDAQVLALSPQSVASHEAFSQKHGGFAFPLLADENKEVGRLYGVVGPLGFYRRSVFVIDAAGVVRHAHRAIAGVTYQSTEAILKALRH